MNVINESEMYNYLNEAVIVDSIKRKINAIKDSFNRAKNKEEMGEVKEEAAELKQAIKDSAISSKMKNMLLATLIGIFTATATANATDIKDLGAEFNLKKSTIEYDGTGTIWEPEPSEVVEDAKYLAVALKKAKIKGIEVEDVQYDGQDQKGGETAVYNFTDGITVSVNIKDVIFIYDNGVLIRQYENGYPAMNALLDLAKHF